MRLRNMTALTNDEVEWYLQRNDVMFVPVGTVELHGCMPMDVEYTLIEALAYKLAEDCDGLVLPHLAYFHPGATTIGRGTVYMSMRHGMEYLKNICDSLVRQGFRRIVFLSAHGPSFQTIMPFLTEYFDDKKIPFFHGDLFLLADEAGMGPDEIDDMMVGAYKLMNRLNEIPVEGELEPYALPDSGEKTPVPEFMKKLMPKRAFSYYTAWYYGDKCEHGDSRPVCSSEEELEKMAQRGIKYFDTMVKRLRFSEKLDALRALDAFTRDTVLRRYGEWLP